MIIDREEFPKRALNLVGDGGYLVWRYPLREIFLDARPGLYPPGVIRDSLAGLMSSAQAAAAVADQWQADAVILNANWIGYSPALLNLLRSGWRFSYFDGTTSILLRRGIQHAALAGDRTVQQHGLDVLESERVQYRDRIQGTFGAPVSGRLVGAANTFFTLQRFPDAYAALDLLLRNAPNMKSGWLNLGLCQIQLDRTEQAVASLERAVRESAKNVRAWLWLSRAYAAVGRPGEAAGAFDRAASLNPEEAARFGNPAKPDVRLPAAPQAP